MSRRPNILWITTDQQRWDTIAALGAQGVRTPDAGWSRCGRGSVRAGILPKHGLRTESRIVPDRSLSADDTSAAKWSDAAAR